MPQPEWEAQCGPGDRLRRVDPKTNEPLDEPVEFEVVDVEREELIEGKTLWYIVRMTTKLLFTWPPRQPPL